MTMMRTATKILHVSGCRRFLRHLWTICCVLAGCAGGPETLERFEFTRVQMGVEARIVLYAPNREAAGGAAADAFAEIARLDAIFSDYRVDSELLRLCDQPPDVPVPISAELFEVLHAAQTVSAATQGAFDITAGPLTQLWRNARRTGELPSDSELQAARERVDWRMLTLDPESRTAKLNMPGMRLDLGGIAKGYTADRARRTVSEAGYPRCLVALAGDIAVGDPPPGRKGWKIEIEGIASAPPDQQAPSQSKPRAMLLRNACVSTSGDLDQIVEIGGQRYSHIVDPRSGWRAPQQHTVTVVAKRGELADALSSALCVDPAMVPAVLKHFPDVSIIRSAIVPDGITREVHGPQHRLHWEEARRPVQPQREEESEARDHSDI